jgi:excisionase family DNA binding protein
MENLFNVTQVAYILKVHPLTVRRYIKEGKLKAVKIGGNIRIKESDLSDFSKDFSPNKQLFKNVSKNKNVVKIFDELDPFLQLQGKGASLSITK